MEPENDAELLREEDRRRVSKDALSFALHALEEKGQLRRAHTPKGGSDSSTPKKGSSSSKSHSHSKDDKSTKDKNAVRELEKRSRKSLDEDPEEASSDGDSVSSLQEEKSLKDHDKDKDNDEKSVKSTSSSSSHRHAKKSRKSMEKGGAKSPVSRSGSTSVTMTGVNTPLSPVPGMNNRPPLSY